MLDYDGILGHNDYEQRLMPLVTIDKITLENNSVPPIATDDPHIADTEADVLRRQSLGLSTRPSTYNSPEIPSSPAGCYVTIDLIVRDIIENDGLSSWFYDAELLKYMHIKIVQSVNKNLTKRLILGDLAALQNPESAPYFEEKILSLQQYHESTKDFYSTPASGRGLVADIPYETSFYLNENQPQHLSYFAFCFFDIQEMIADYNLNLYGYNKNQGIVSKDITSETVIQDGSVVSEAFIFYTPEGKVWSGAVHQHNGVWMAGASHTSAPHPILTRETAINSKVQDFRDIDDVILEQINLQPIEAVIQRLGQKTSATEIKVEENISYLSESFMSSDMVDNKRSCSFTFSFDYRGFLRQNSEYGKMLDSLAGTRELESILQRSGILSFKVYRHRVTDLVSFNSINSPVRGIPFKETSFINVDKAPVLVVSSSDARGILKSSKTEKGSIREIDLGNASDLRTFAVTDVSVGDKTSGLYRYSIEIKIQDGSVDYLNLQMLNFSKAKEQFELYNNVCSSPDYYNLENKSFTSGLKNHYDIMQRRDGGVVDPSQYPWIQAPAILCSLIAVLNGTVGPQIQNIYQKLVGLSNASTGSPEGVSATLGLMQNMESIMIRLLGDNKPTSANVSQKSGSPATFEKFILTDNHTFSSIYDVEVEHNYGANYLGIQNRNDYSGPFTITVSDYLSRLGEENSKYFTNGSPRMSSVGLGSGEVSIPEFGDFASYGASYLTPALAYAGSEVLNIKSNPDIASDPARFTDFGLSALSLARGSGNGLDSNRDFLGLQGVSIEEQSTESSSEKGTIESKDFVGLGSAFVSDDISYKDYEDTLSETDALNNITAVFAKDEALEDQLSIECFLLDSQDACQIYGNYTNPVDNTIDTERIKQIPNQIKSLFFSKNSSISKHNWFDYNGVDVAKYYKTSMMFILNYQVICKVEYLEGYQDTGTEGQQPASPVWETLTYDALQQIRDGRKAVLCRLSHYYDSTYRIGQSSFSKMPLYNSHFYIAPDEGIAQRVSRRRTPQSRSPNIYNTLLQIGASLQSQQSLAERGALKTITNQRKPKNSSGDVDNPNKNLEDYRMVSNTFELLLDEASGVCTAAIPRAESMDVQEEYYNPNETENPEQDDNFDDLEEDFNLPDPDSQQVDYEAKAKQEQDTIVKDTSKDNAGSPEDDMLNMYVQETYDIPALPDTNASVDVDTVSVAGSVAGSMSTASPGGVY